MEKGAFLSCTLGRRCRRTSSALEAAEDRKRHAEAADTRIILEVDENRHAFLEASAKCPRSSYSVAMESTRGKGIYHSLPASENLLFVRLNPDGYKVDGKQAPNHSIEARAQALHKALQEMDRDKCRPYNVLGKGLKVA